MKKTVIFVIAALFIFVACTEKKEEISQTNTKVQAQAKKEVVAEKKETVTPTVEMFSKGGNIHDIKMKSISSGKVVDFSQYKGKKILFDFWSSWCEPCIEMFPIINRLKREVEDGKGTLKILSISVDPMPGKIKEIMKKKKVEFEVLNAPPELANSGILMPYLAVADENGKIFATSNGKHTFKEILKMINGEKSPAK